MLTIKETKTGTDIEYSKGGIPLHLRFLLLIFCQMEPVSGLQISPNGDTDDILLEKNLCFEG